MSEDEDMIEISEEEVNLSIGGTKIRISGIISKRHAQILVLAILGMLGYNYPHIVGMF